MMLTIWTILIGLAAAPCGVIGETVRIPGESPILFYDMTPLFDLDLNDPAQRRRFWDESHLVAALQGLANRESATLYIRYNQEPDDFWWNLMTGADGWLEGHQVIRVDSLEDLLVRLACAFKGAVVWDERVPATSNLASTLAGSEDLLPFRYDPAPGSLYDRFVQNGPQIPIRKRLLQEDGSPLFSTSEKVPGTEIPSTGSAKCDPYLWLIENYVKTGKVDAGRLCYTFDGSWLSLWNRGAPQNHTLTNHDFMIARRGIFFDLGVWDDEAPVDDPTQKPGMDANTLRRLLRAAYEATHGERMIHAAGFVPWAYKYTNHGPAGGHHDPVPTEWRYAEILSCFNAYMDADALGYSAMANASFFQHFPLPDAIPQNPKPTNQQLTERGFLDQDGKVLPKHYVAHYVGDYDSAAWMYWKLPSIWNDPARGRVPLSWALNPNLAERFPLGMMWTRQTRTPNDSFIAGDSGAGYLNPGYLSEPRSHSGLPSGIAAWERHNSAFFRQWDITITGFIIDGYAPGLSEEGLDAYSRFSSDGIVAQKIPKIGMHKEMPYLRMGIDLPDDPKDAAAAIQKAFNKDAPQFLVFRSILKSPSWYMRVSEDLEQQAGGEVLVVDLHTLMALVKTACNTGALPQE